jgi:hypothetical protein
VTFQNVDLETIMRPTNEDYYHGLLDGIAIDLEKSISRGYGRPFIAVHERMIPERLSHRAAASSIRSL